MTLQDKKQQKWYINKLKYNREYTKNHPEVRQKFLDTHPNYVKNWNKKRINFKGKQIPLRYNPRLGVCMFCGKQGITNLHHLKYDENNPVEHTIELCMSCHRKEHITEYSMTRAAINQRRCRARKKLRMGDN